MISPSSREVHTVNPGVVELAFQLGGSSLFRLQFGELFHYLISEGHKVLRVADLG